MLVGLLFSVPQNIGHILPNPLIPIASVRLSHMIETASSTFVFGFGWGMRGAAFATVLSQAVSAGWVLALLSPAVVTGEERAMLSSAVRSLYGKRRSTGRPG